MDEVPPKPPRSDSKAKSVNKPPKIKIKTRVLPPPENQDLSGPTPHVEAPESSSRRDGLMLSTCRDHQEGNIVAGPLEKRSRSQGSTPSSDTEQRTKRQTKIKMQNTCRDTETNDDEEDGLTLPYLTVQTSSDEEDTEDVGGTTSRVCGARKRVAKCPPGELDVLIGSIPNLKSSEQIKQCDVLVRFMRRHQYGDETIKGVNAENGAVQLVLLSVPSGLHVNGIRGGDVPSWNVVSPSLIADGLSLASKIVCDYGWVACVHTFEQSNQVQKSAKASGLDLWRCFTMVCNMPIYHKPDRHKTKIYSLGISMFHQSGMPAPRPYYLQAAQMDHHECSLTRDLLLDKIDVQEWLCKADGTPWRGGAQRSNTLWQFLLLAFTRYADSVVDLIAGTGSFIRVASELGRHALGIESDKDIVNQLLKASILSISINCEAPICVD